MGSFFSLIENLALGLYVICGFFLLRSLLNFWRAKAELRLAQYGLERELAERQGGRALTTLFLTVELLILVWGISNIASPTWSEGLPPTLDTVNQRRFLTNTPSSEGSFVVNTRQPTEEGILSTAAPPSTPQGTILPAAQRAFCTPGQAWIELPANGQLIFEETTIQGTANIENFSKYRFEIKGVNSSEFSVMGGDNIQPVTDGPLGSISPAALFPGEYRFRLMVFDTTNIVKASCEITIWIDDPQPTPTPLGGGLQQ